MNHLFELKPSIDAEIPTVNDNLTTQTTIEELYFSYRSNQAISQSSLKLVETPYLVFGPKKNSNSKPYFSIGTITDKLLTMPYGENYFILLDKPSGKMLDMADRIIDFCIDQANENILDNLGKYRENINQIRTEVEYDGRLKLDTVINNIVDNAGEYIDETLNNPEKLIISPREYSIGKQIYESMKNNDLTSKYVLPQKGIIRLYQVIIYFTYLGVKCKAALDAIDIDIINNTVTPIDYKTTGFRTAYFPSRIKQLKYHIQAASYSYALELLVQGNALGLTYRHKEDEFGIELFKSNNLPDLEILEVKNLVDITNFKVLPFKFIVETSLVPEIGISPKVFICSKEILHEGFYGAYEDKKFIPADFSSESLFTTLPKIPGFKTCIEYYKWNLETGIHNLTKKEYNDIIQYGGILL